MSAKELIPGKQQNVTGKLLTQSHVADGLAHPLNLSSLDKSYRFHELPWTVGLNANTAIVRDIKTVAFGSNAQFTFRGVNIRPDSLFLKLTLPIWDNVGGDYIVNIFDCIQQITISIGNQQIAQYGADLLNLFYVNLQDDEYRTFLSAISHINKSVAACKLLASANTTYYIPLFLTSSSNRMDLIDINYPMLRTNGAELKIDITFRAVTSTSPKWVLNAIHTNVPVLSNAEIMILDEKSNQSIESYANSIPNISKQTTVTHYTENVAQGATNLVSKIQLSSKVYAILIRVYQKTAYDAGDTINTFYDAVLNTINSLKFTVNGSVVYDSQQQAVALYNNMEKFCQFGHLQFLNTGFLIIPLGDSFIKNLHNSYGYVDMEKTSNSQIELTFTATPQISTWMFDIFEHQIVSIDNNICKVLK